MEQKKIGVIGYGSMGKMLVQGFLRHGIAADDIVVANRHLEKMQHLGEQYPVITLTTDNREAALCKYVFLCVEPLQMAGVLANIVSVLSAETHLITIGGAGDIASYAKVFPGAISRVIPTLLAEIDRGYTLISHGEKVLEQDRLWLTEILAKMGKVAVVTEDKLKTFMQFTSCGPAFIAGIFVQWLDCGKKVLAAEDQGILFDTLLETVSGTVAFMQQTNMSFDEMVARVATKGGITERGVQILETGLSPVFTELVSACNMRNDAAAQRVDEAIQEIGK